MPEPATENRYRAIIEKIFFSHWKDGVTSFEFRRTELKEWADKLDIIMPDNPGDILYSFRFRTPLPQPVIDTQPEGLAWRIELAGRARYRFVLVHHSGEALSLSRYAGVKPKELAARLGDPKTLPTLDQVRSLQRDGRAGRDPRGRPLCDGHQAAGGDEGGGVMASLNATVKIYLPWYVLPSIRLLRLACALGVPAPTSDAVAAWIVRQVRTKVLP